MRLHHRPLALLLALTLVSPSIAQPPSAPATPPAPVTAAERPPFRPSVLPNRADLALAYLNFERTLAAHPPKTPADSAEINKAFDGLTLLFFTGNFSEAIKRLHALTDRVEGTQPSDAYRAARSLKLTPEPRIVNRALHKKLTLHFTSLYRLDTPLDPAAKFSVMLTSMDGKFTSTHDGTFRVLENGGIEADLELDIAKDAPAFPACLAIAPAFAPDAFVPAGRVSIVDSSLDQQAADLLATLPYAAATKPELKSALNALRSRIALLKDAPSELISAEFLLDPVEHLQLVTAEAAAVAKGQDPYRYKTGAWWRSVPTAGADLSVRFYCPDVKQLEILPLPVIITLHGMGGDENMFPDAYGHGLITRLADKHGFLVVSPRSENISGAGVFDALMSAVNSHYLIDPERVYVIGHSMGAGGAAVLSRQQIKTVAAVACLAGGPQRAVAKPVAPMLVYAAELDPILRPQGLAAAAKAGAERGFAIEYREAKAQGHTLMVSAVLDEAVTWLLAKKLDIAERERWLQDAAPKPDPAKP